MRVDCQKTSRERKKLRTAHFHTSLFVMMCYKCTFDLSNKRRWIFIQAIYHCCIAVCCANQIKYTQTNNTLFRTHTIQFSSYTVSSHSFFIHTRHELTSMWVAHNWFFSSFLLFYFCFFWYQAKERKKKNTWK